MSLANRATTTTVNVHESIEIPTGVALAFNRSLDIFSRGDSFIDRCLALGNTCNEIIAWRWAGIIDQTQCSYLLRKLRKTAQEDLGSITQNELRSAFEVQESEEASAELTADIERMLNPGH
jgi:hypothetical protein